MSESNDSLYSRLGGYDAIASVAHNLVSRLRSDQQLGRFWLHRGENGIQRELQLLIDFLCAASGGSLLYTGREMTETHRGMKIDESDWVIFMAHVSSTLQEFNVGDRETGEVTAFIESLKSEIVEPSH